MGSYNTTCFATNQTIATKDRAIIFPIRQQTSYKEIDFSFKDGKYKQPSFASSPCHSTRFWTYAGPHLTGVYKDCGQFILDKTTQNIRHLNILFRHLYSDAAKTEQGDNEHHDLAFDMKSLYDLNKEYPFEELIEIFGQVWKSANEYRVFISGYNGIFFPLVPFSFAVMHERVTNYLISEMDGSWDRESYQRFDFVKRHYIDAQERLSFVKDRPQSGNSKISQYLLMLADALTLRDACGSNESGYFHRYYGVDLDDILGLLGETDDVEITDELINKALLLFNPMLDMMYINMGLNWLNVSVIPMVYCDQDYDNTNGRNYAKMVSMISEEVIKDRKSQYDDDDE